MDVEVLHNGIGKKLAARVQHKIMSRVLIGRLHVKFNVLAYANVTQGWHVEGVKSVLHGLSLNVKDGAAKRYGYRGGVSFHTITL